MKNISPIFRISFGLVGLMTSLTLISSTLGVFPDRAADVVRSRKQLCESLGVSFSALANRVGKESLEATFQDVLERTTDVESIGIRLENNQMLLEVGDHSEQWKQSNLLSSNSQISVPIYTKSGMFGTMEMRFEPIQGVGIAGYLRSPEFIFVAFLAITAFVTFYFYLRYVLKQLNPKKAVPKRVREALDSLAEGLLILDSKERIVLANGAFQRITGWTQDMLLGKCANEIPFLPRDDSQVSMTPHPWQATLSDGTEVRGRLLGLDLSEGRSPTFSVSCSPILDDHGNSRGAIASFEDVTQLEEKKSELLDMVQQLNDSADEIKSHNRKLEILATRDVLTGCTNRRFFFEAFESHWDQAVESGEPLSALMVDIDHFKSINDTHGHGVGDDVLRLVGATLRDSARGTDVVSRYGGEEFAILMPNTLIHAAEIIAEQIRKDLEMLEFPSLTITASVGVSAIGEGAVSPHALLEQADKCLYMAKRNGRNQVVCWNSVPDEVEIAESEVDLSSAEIASSTPTIPFHAVTALISAMACRDMSTANHCRRVADLCVSVAEGLLPMKDCYVLEIAGLLHDIGRIGVPDAILNATGNLSEEEQATLRMYETLGVNLIDTSFACPQLTEIVVNYRKRFADRDLSVASQSGLPIGARILAIVDAYDSLMCGHHDSLDETGAIEEIRKRAGDEFDPELVERFAYVLKMNGKQGGNTILQVSKDAALSIGLQMEKLAAALDARDSTGISVIANCIRETSMQHGADRIADKAAQIASLPDADSDLYEIVQTANELLDLCRLSQRSLLTVGDNIP